jgi:hypothetical protein
METTTIRYLGLHSPHFWARPWPSEMRSAEPYVPRGRPGSGIDPGAEDFTELHKEMQ